MDECRQMWVDDIHSRLPNINHSFVPKCCSSMLDTCHSCKDLHDHVIHFIFKQYPSDFNNFHYAYDKTIIDLCRS